MYEEIYQKPLIYVATGSHTMVLLLQVVLFLSKGITSNLLSLFGKKLCIQRNSIIYCQHIVSK